MKENPGLESALMHAPSVPAMFHNGHNY